MLAIITRAATAAILRATAAAAVALATLAACQTAPPQPDPTGRADADMNRVLTQLAAMNPKPIESLTPAEARLQPTAAMAATRVQQQATGSAAPMPVALVRDIQVPGAAGPLQVRLYNPAPGGGPLPVILYFGGGGWVIADLDTYDASARALATGANAVVVSVFYRRGPENRFPAAHDDAAAAYTWLHANAGSLGGDPRRIALAGESAGGNLAITTAMAARNTGLPRPAAILSVYPVAGTSTNTPSARENAMAKPLNTAMLPWFLQYYTSNTPQELNDPRLNLVETADLRGLPPTTIVLAEIDPLRSGGEMLTEKLRAAGVPVESRTYPGVTHEFFGMGSVVRQAKTAEDFAIQRLRAAFATEPAAAPAAVNGGAPVRRPLSRR